MRSVSRLLSYLTAILAASSTNPVVMASADCAPTSHRIVAIGDVHGNSAGLETILGQAGLRDKRGEWTGGDAILIHTGDLIDRGPNDREVLELLMDLEGKARKAGGQVQVLLGNHEVMNLYGDLRYVAQESFARFADNKSEKRLAKAYKEYQRFLKTKARFLGEPEPSLSEETEKEWYASYPAGYLAHREAFSVSGRYGKWLRKRLAIWQEGGYIFLHGGINPALPANLEKLNSIIRQEVDNYDQLRDYLAKQSLIPAFSSYKEALSLADLYADHLRSRQESLTPEEEILLSLFETLASSTSWLSVHPDGPLWFRGFARWSEEEGQSAIDELADRFGVCGFVVGHTPQLENGIEVRFGGRVFLIDTGMLDSYYEGGIPSALEIGSKGFTAVYPDANRVELSIGYQNTP